VAHLRAAASRRRPLLPGLVTPFWPNTVSDAGTAKYFTPAEIRAALDRVHEQVLRVLPRLDEAELDQPVPHPFAKARLLALLGAPTTSAVRRPDRLAAPSAGPSADVVTKGPILADGVVSE
jgi:hypothetical protein